MEQEREGEVSGRQREVSNTDSCRCWMSYFPSTSFPGNGKGSVGVSAVLDLEGAEEDEDATLGMSSRTMSTARTRAMRTMRAENATVSLARSAPSDCGHIRQAPPASTTAASIVDRSLVVCWEASRHR
jgi:hypothetical protein